MQLDDSFPRPPEAIAELVTTFHGYDKASLDKPVPSLSLSLSQVRLLSQKKKT
jgi:hypothetical protein